MQLKQRHLYFICPTDHLEPVINGSFKYKNYYYTSLGNSVVFSDSIIDEIEHLILEHNIKKISFVLSSTNSIVLDALRNQKFSGIRGLSDCYDEIVKQKEYSDIFWYKYDRHFTMLSYYLNIKIRELKLKLDSLIIDQIKIDGKIYDTRENVFDNIYSDLMCSKSFSLN